MTENQIDPPEFQEVPEKKTNKTLWIILAVFAVVIICCICVALVLIFLIPADRYQQLRYGLMPFLAFL